MCNRTERHKGGKFDTCRGERAVSRLAWKALCRGVLTYTEGLVMLVLQRGDNQFSLVFWRQARAADAVVVCSHVYAADGLVSVVPSAMLV